MMPGNVLASQYKKSAFMVPDNKQSAKGFDYEIGGIAITDPSQGLRVQTWGIRWIGGIVAIFSPTQPDRILFEVENPIKRAALAFDQNMRPSVAFSEDTPEGFRNRLYWYDPTTQAHTFMELPLDAIYPAISLDDTNLEHTSTSDMLLAYINEGGDLTVLRQRDRFLVPYIYPTNLSLGSYVEKVGMNVGNRFQFKIATPLYAS